MIDKIRVLEVLYVRDTDPLELLLSLFESMWGFWILIWPLLGFDLSKVAIAFWVGRSLWGIMLLIQGSVKYYAIMTQAAGLRRQTSFTAACLFMFLSIQAWVTAPAMTPVATCLTLILVNTFLYLRLKILPPYDPRRKRGQ